MSNSDDTAKQEPEQNRYRSMSAPADSRHWRVGVYANPNDPRAIVPRNNGLGSTINFSNPQSKIIVGAFLIAILPILIAVVIIALTHR